MTGVWRLVRLALRRDRIQLPVWVAAVFVTVAGGAASVADTYPTSGERLKAVRSMAESPALLIFRAPPTGPELGALTAAQLYASVAFAVALMSTMAVVRHTRQNEETGRTELLGSSVVGRHAPLVAALVVVVLANVVMAIAIAAGLASADLGGSGAVLTGVSIAGIGIVFAGIAAVAAQLSETSRGANGLAVAAIGFFFLLAGVGNVAGETVASGTKVVSAWPSWLSPFGWGEQTRPYAEDVWAPVLLLAIAFVALVAVAFALTNHRDVGLGMLPTRLGPPSADRALLSPLGLAWRLQRGALLAWAIAMVVLGVTYGSLGQEVEELLEGNSSGTDLIKDLGGDSGSLVDAYFGTVMTFMAAASAGYTVQALLRLRSEETGPLESVLATSVSRGRWLASHVLCAVLGTAFLLAVCGFATGLTYGLIAGDVADQIGNLSGAAVVQIPASLTLSGFVIAAFGLLPRRAVAVSWAALAVCLVLGQLGELLQLPQVVMDLSPFTHIPNLPAADFAVVPILVLLVLAAGLGGLGVTSFRRRDLALT